MRLPKFDYLEPASLTEALNMKGDLGTQAAILAGGTDLLVRMKQRLLRPAYLISLKNLSELRGIVAQGHQLIIGAATSLREVIRCELVRKWAPALAESLEAVGALTIQRFRGTIGGNLCQDTRCLFYNQSSFWRSGRSPCHKAGGKVCHAKEGSDRCRSTSQSDGATALLALGAKVTLESVSAKRTVGVKDLFTMKGEAPLDIGPQEVLTEIMVPMVDPFASSAYERISYRSAIDFPVASAAVWVKARDGIVEDARICVGAMTSAPLLVQQAAEVLKGRTLNDLEGIQRASRIAVDNASAFVVDNVGSSPQWRVEMVGVLVERALRKACLRAVLVQGEGDRG